MASRCGQGVAQQAIPARPRPPHPPPEQEQEYDFLEEPAREFFCAVSLDLLREPQQTDCCGHHFSEDVAHRLRSGGKPCPVCQRADFTTHPDIFHRRKVRQLTVHCQHKENGCGWVGELGNLRDHVTLCPKQPWKCVYCTLTGLKECESDHVSVCGQYPVLCPNRCEEGEVPRSSLEQHLSLCPLQEVECEYAEMGCEVRLARREMRGHLEKEGQNHLLKMCAASLAVSRELSRRAGEREREVVELREEVRRVREEMGGIKKELKEGMREMEASRKEGRQDVREIRKELNEGMREMEKSRKEGRQEVMEMERRVREEVGKGMGEVRKEVRELKEEMGQKIEEEMRTIREENKKSEGRVVEGVREMEQRVKKDMELVMRGVCDIRHEVADLKTPVEFTITNFSVLKAQGKEWRSPPFCTHHGGYKMCLGVWPDGLGFLSGSHVSVRFYKVRDANTNSLKWPVYLPITMQCLNQTTGKWEKEYTNGTGLLTRGKPSTDVECSSSYPKYIPHSELAEYVKNDSFCIRVTKFTVQ